MIKKTYENLKKKVEIINYGINYPDGKSHKYDKSCDDTFFKYLDIIINTMWFIFTIVSIVNVAYFIRYHV